MKPSKAMQSNVYIHLSQSKAKICDRPIAKDIMGVNNEGGVCGL